MIPRILNFQARMPADTEECAPEIKFIENGESLIGFDPNTLLALELSRDQVMQINANLRDGSLNNWPHALFHTAFRPKFDLPQDTSCRQLTLHLTDRCNLNCSYCWQRVPHSALRTPQSAMPLSIAEAALKLFPEHAREIRIGFFGGEPLLEFGLLRDITNMVLVRYGSRAHFHVTTNGTLITEEIAGFLADCSFSIIVSCDGPPWLHDVSRGEGTFVAMKRGLMILNGARCSDRVVLRGTWSDPPYIVERLSVLNELCADGLAAGVALEPVAGAPWTEMVKSDIHSAAECFALRVRSGETSRWRYLEKILGRILWQQWQPSECGAGRGYYTVAPNGAIYACHKQQHAAIGRIGPIGPIFDEAARQKWLDNRLTARRGCSLCWARNVCGGGCRSESLEFCGEDISKPHEGRCMLMRQLVEEALKLAATLPRETLLRICPAPNSF